MPLETGYSQFISYQRRIDYSIEKYKHPVKIRCTAGLLTTDRNLY